MDFKNLKEKISKQKVWRLLPNILDFQKETIPWGVEFKNLKKIYRLSYGFLFFVISISGENYDFTTIRESSSVKNPKEKV
jgi:hypothetical protein